MSGVSNEEENGKQTHAHSHKQANKKRHPEGEIATNNGTLQEDVVFVHPSIRFPLIDSYSADLVLARKFPFF
jgi:hypothetical protein